MSLSGFFLLTSAQDEIPVSSPLASVLPVTPPLRLRRQQHSNLKQRPQS